MPEPLVSVVIPTFNRKGKASSLIASVLKSDHMNLEIIVVDDASRDGTLEYLKSRYPEIKIIRNEKELLLSRSRNVGIENSKGEFIFLVDDDNVVDPQCISKLTDAMMDDPSIGLLMPAIYSSAKQDRIIIEGVKRNMYTSVTSFIRKKGGLVESDDCPNAMMARRKALEEAGPFDARYLFHYDEADLGERLRKAGYGVFCHSEAKVFHNHPMQDLRLRSKTVHTPMRAYFTGRNRLLFHRMHSSPLQLLVFLFIFYPLILLYYSYWILRHSKGTNTLPDYLKGNLHGLMFFLFGRLPENQYQ